MTHPSREYEDRLRRALRAAADSVEPSPDGLGRIRARLTPPRPVVAAWMVTETEPSMLRLRSLLNSLRLRVGRPRGQFRPAPAGTGAARHKLRTQQSWLRPVAVAAAFVVILGSGAFAISKLMQTSAPQPGGSVAGGVTRHGSAGAHGGGGVSGGGSTLPGSGWPGSNSHGAHGGFLAPPLLPASGKNPPPSASCSPTPTPTPTPSTSVTPTPTPTPSTSPTATPTPTSTPTATPTPADTTTPTPTPTATSPASSVTPSASATPKPSDTKTSSPGPNQKAC
jgi:hypothetical protein